MENDKMTVIELKAIVYDLSAEFESLENQKRLIAQKIQNINELITKKINEKKK